MWQRFSTHFFHLRAGDHANKFLQAAYDEHGLPAFTCEIVAEVPADRLKDAESEWINRHGISNLYNIITVSPTKVTRVNKFVEFINSHWLLPDADDIELPQLYKIWRTEDKNKILKLAKECWLLDTPVSRFSFIAVIKLMQEKLGYKIETGQSLFGGEKHTYKLITAYDPAASTYIPPYPAPDSTPVSTNYQYKQ